MPQNKHIKDSLPKGRVNIDFNPALLTEIRRLSKTSKKSMTQLINELCYASIALGDLEESASENPQLVVMPHKTIFSIPTDKVVDICFFPQKVTSLFPIIREAYLDYLEHFKVV